MAFLPNFVVKIDKSFTSVGLTIDYPKSKQFDQLGKQCRFCQKANGVTCKNLTGLQSFHVPVAIAENGFFR